jgi:hypothetical protein
VSTQTINHGLGVAPELIIAKERESGSGTGDWAVWHKDLSSGKYLVLNDSAGEASWSDALFSNINDTSVDVQNDSGSGIYLNDGMGPNTYVAYFFASKAGYSKVGSYTGNGSADGPFIYTGFRVRWLLSKNADRSAVLWNIHDTERDPYNLVDTRLWADSSSSEDSLHDKFDFYSNGFMPRTADTGHNGNGETIIYYAIAESPFKYASAR